MPSNHGLKPYPTPQLLRVGIKVSWHYYQSEADAKVASEAAKHNGRFLEEQGFDFGYQSPGFIRMKKPGDIVGKLPAHILDGGDLYEVVTP